MNVDPEGTSIILSTILFMVVGALVGATVSAGTSIVTQAIFNDGEINWKSVAVSAVSGAINGALSASPLSVGWLMAAGGVLGAATYIADSKVNNQDITLLGVVSSIGFGVLSAKIGGNGANYKFSLSNSIEQAKNSIIRETRRANQKYAQKVILSISTGLKNQLLDTTIASSVRFYLGTQLSMIFGEIL